MEAFKRYKEFFILGIDTRRIRDFGRAPFLPRRNNDREKKSIPNVARPSLKAGALTLLESVNKMQGGCGGKAAREGDREMTD